jgi:hypothetical protein
MECRATATILRQKRMMMTEMRSKQIDITQKKSNLLTRNYRYTGQISWGLLFHPIIFVNLVAWDQRRP